MKTAIYEVETLAEARKYLAQINEKVILSNPQGSTKYYGIRVIDYIFKKLQDEFPSKIERIIVDVYDDYSAFITAKELGYETIKYEKCDDAA